MTLRGGALVASVLITGQCLAQTQEQDPGTHQPPTWAQTQRAQDPPSQSQPAAGQDLPQAIRNSLDDQPSQRGLTADIKAYYTAPLHWNGSNWAYFGASLAAIGLAYHFDDQVRTHFVAKAPSNTHELKDAIPTASLFVGTWLYASLIDDSNGRSEAGQMLEAGGLSTVTGYAIKFATGRGRPNETADKNSWRTGGSSFPSMHTTAAFAVGTVMAESGSDDYRWPRRFLGYGVAIGTGYLRLKHNAHWLSDTIAGAALGTATARFVMNRSKALDDYSGLMLVPADGGVMLTYRKSWP